MADLISYQRLVDFRDYRRSVGRPLWYCTLLDLSCVCHGEPPGRILRLSICPIDDGGASLYDRPVVQQDRQTGLLGAAALGQNYVDARRPIDLLVSNAVPVERPSSLLAIMRNSEGNESSL
jgi:hypothetical protein